MVPLVILFADFTIVICAVGAILMGVLVFSDWNKKKEHGDHPHDSTPGHH